MRARWRRSGPAADLLGFLESLGFRFELARDDTIVVHAPPMLRCITSHVQAVLPAIRVALEARQAKPATAGQARLPRRQPALGEPALLHRRRGEWDAYVWLGELHPVFAGSATSEGEARRAAREKFAAVASTAGKGAVRKPIQGGNSNARVKPEAG